MDLKNIRQNVFRYLAKKNRSALLDDCIALIIAEILGYINKKNAYDYKPWDSFCLGIKNYNTLNKSGLLEKIKTEILQNFPLEKKREWLEAKLIYSFDMEYIIFDDSFINVAKNQKYSLRTNYGEKDYSTARIKTVNELPKDNIEATKETTIKNYFICDEENELNKVWKILETEERKNLFPFWKWKISTSEFAIIENKLIALIKSKDQGYVIRHHSYKLALYYSEWYKRRYLGNDSVIDSVFIPISPKSIWNHLSSDIKNKYLITINESNNKTVRWDDSLKLLGGLPLSYLTRGENNPSRVFAKVFNDLRNRAEPDLNELDINNQALRQSTKSGGSIFEYINELIDENYYFAETDREESPFKEFIAFVESGLKEYKENKSKKFSILWQVKQHPDFIYIHPTVYAKLKPEENGVNRLFIDDKRINDWGIYETLISFEILVRLKYSETDKIDETGGFYFNRCSNGKFLCRSEVKWKINDNPKNLEKIEFVLKSGDLEKTIQTEKLPNYIQLWNSGYGEWSNRQINGSRSSVLFLSDKALTKEANQQIVLKSKKQDYYWANINNELIIINNGKDERLYQKNGTIDVRPKERDLFKNIVLYNEDGMLSYVKEGTLSLVYLVREPITLNVYFIDRFGSNKVEINSNDYSIQYMQLGMSGFKPYPSDEKPLDQGFARLKIVYKEIYEETLDCYVLKSNANIRRITESKRVLFEHIENIFLDSSVFTVLCNREIVDDEKNQLEIDTFNIRIGVEDNYVEMPVIRPLNRNNDIFHGRELITNNDFIPIKYSDSFVVRSINNDGVVHKVLADEITKFQKLRVIYNNNKAFNNRDATGIREMPNLVRLTTYTRMINQSETIYFLAEGKKYTLDSFKNYKFCFLSLKEQKVEDLYLQNIKTNDHNYIGFSVDKKVDGIVFQSFKDDNYIYQETYRPFFFAANKSKINSNTKRDAREKRIAIYNQNFDYRLAISHFEIAIEHNLYFGTFDILLAMEYSPNILAKFYLEYYQFCTSHKQSINYKALYRLADELLFDWILIPRKIWLDTIGNDIKVDKKSWVTRLFRNKRSLSGMEYYALYQCCEKYWDSSLQARNPRHEIYNHIKKEKRLDDFFRESSENKIRLLERLYKDKNLYSVLLGII